MKINPEHEDSTNTCESITETKRQVLHWLRCLIPNWKTLQNTNLRNIAGRIAKMLWRGDTIMARMNGETLEIRATKRKN